jgi:hypothetical protein
MTTPPADLSPLTTDEEVLARIRMLIGPASNRRLWLMFVDGDGRQSPVIAPISGPQGPRGLAVLAQVLTGLRSELGRGALILTWERPGSDTVLPADRVWAEALAETCSTADVPLRGAFLSTPGGVQRLG